MPHYILNKYTAIAIAVQLGAFVSVWILALALSPIGDRYFVLIFYFYWPTIILAGKLLGASGEGAMFSVPICGLGLASFFMPW